MSEEATILGAETTPPATATPAVTPAAPATPAPPQQAAPFVGEGLQFKPGWYNELGEDMAEHAEGLKKFNTVKDLAKSYRHLEKMRGIPAPDADEDAVSAFRKAAGLPETPENYVVKPEELPEGVEWDENLAKELGSLVHKHHGTPALANELASMHLQLVAKAQEQMATQQAAARARQEADLKEAWGRDFDANLGNAAKVANMLGLDANDPAIGNNIPLLKALATMSAKLSEGTIKGAAGGQQSGLGDLTGARAKARDIVINSANPDNKAFHDPSDPRHAEVNARVDQLNAQASRMK